MLGNGGERGSCYDWTKRDRHKTLVFGDLVGMQDFRLNGVEGNLVATRTAVQEENGAWKIKGLP